MNPFDTFDWLQLFVLLVCGAGLYQAAALDDASGWGWAGASVGVYAFTWLVLRVRNRGKPAVPTGHARCEVAK